MRKKFYITAAIDYVNSLPHLGTAYEKIGCDVIARYKRMQGYKVQFLMGNDEHSTNVEKAAKKTGLTPKKYCDKMRGEFEKVWQKLEISYDDFIQTSDPKHAKAVQDLLQKVCDRGYIYKKMFAGWYCESCEAYFTEKDLVNGLCPNHKSKPKWLEEENYFFKLSDSTITKKLLDKIHGQREFILPESRRNEILRFVEGGLEDISISRSSTSWGIPIPFDKTQVVYVWFDALINYLSGVGYPNKKYKNWWPADLHVIGKDITRFHCIIWPAMLIAAGIDLPKSIFGHGFVYLKGEKMSKTLGNIVNPLDVVEKYGADALRYYLCRTSSFGADSDFTWDDFIRVYNGDLANGLGNLVSRTLGMIEQCCNNTLSKPKKMESSLISVKILGLTRKIQKYVDDWGGNQDRDIEFHTLLSHILGAITELDGYINNKKPWALAKENKLEEVATVLYNVSEGIRILTLLLTPIMPQTAEAIWKKFGFSGKWEKQTFKETEAWGLSKNLPIKKGENLFPRIETQSKEKPMSEVKPEEKKEEALLDIKEFMKLDLRIAEILQAERVEGTDRLLKLQIDIGTEKRQIVAGIAQHYAPEELVGRKVCVVANLKPAKIRGVESNGMLLAAGGGTDVVSILSPVKDIPVGTRVK